MKSAFKSTEFYVALVTNIVGICVVLGAVTVEEGDTLVVAMKGIIGAIISIATTLGYIKSRTDLKVAAMHAAGR